MANIAWRIGETDNITGIQQVAKNIIQRILELDKHNAHILFDKNSLGLNVQESVLPVVYERSEQMISLQAAMLDVDLLHSFYDPCLNFEQYFCKKIITINDLIPVVHRQWFSSGQFWDKWRCRVEASVNAANIIIAISQNTKNDIIRYFKIPEEKIKVIYPGCDSLLMCERQNDINNDELERRFGVKEHYILSVCTLEPRKNLIGLVKAFTAYKAAKKISSLKLVLTGRIGWLTGELFELLSNNPYRKDIILTGYVTIDELQKLYQNALAVAYVSLYEGFGLPILEALSMHKAVICSDTSSMPEVGGDAVCYCHPSQTESIAEAIKKVCEDESYRHLLEEQADAQAAKFSYDRAAEETFALYQSLLDE